MPCTEGLMALSVRWIHPIQQQGRRWPSASSSTARLTCSSRVFCCFTVTVQQIHSLRAIGVILSRHAASALGFASKDFSRSAGISCAAPAGRVIFFINIYYRSHDTRPTVAYVSIIGNASTGSFKISAKRSICWNLQYLTGSPA